MIHGPFRENTPNEVNMLPGMRENIPVAALYVDAAGSYRDLAGVEPWDIGRDARRYAGPHPVVAHPPCQRWGNFYAESPLAIRQGRRKILGDDGGCFESALRWGHGERRLDPAIVERWGLKRAIRLGEVGQVAPHLE